MRFQIVPEWAPQRALLLAFPHPQSDWAAYDYTEVVRPFIQMVQAISYSQPVYLLCHDSSSVKSYFCQKERISFIECPYDDTWVRDYGPISLCDGQSVKLVDFCFNGWGGKYEADRDNAVTNRLCQSGYFGTTPLMSIDFELEGGAIEYDGNGTLMVTTSCLCNSNRNGGPSKAKVEEVLRNSLGIKRVLWLENGYLEGDDTDGHIDMLARFANSTTILYQSCDDRSDPQYEALRLMEEELKAFRDIDGKHYTLIALPMPKALYYEQQRLPASYANFLITNSAVLLPTYGDKESDLKAIEIFKEQFAGREIIPIDARVLVRQGGSIHCSTMQIAK